MWLSPSSKCAILCTKCQKWSIQVVNLYNDGVVQVVGVTFAYLIYREVSCYWRWTTISEMVRDTDIIKHCVSEKKRANFTNLQFRQARTNFDNFYRATRMHRADNAVARCLSSACLSVRLSHAGHTSSKFFHRRVAPPFYSVSQKNRTAKINTTNLQHFTNYFRKGYLIQFSINCVKKFLNWFRTSCAVSITTVATWRNIIITKNRTTRNTTFWHNLINVFFNLNKISQKICVWYS